MTAVLDTVVFSDRERIGGHVTVVGLADLVRFGGAAPETASRSVSTR